MIDVGQVAVGIDGELRGRRTKTLGGPRWRVAEIYKVLPADLTGLELTSPSQQSQPSAIDCPCG